MGHSPQHPPPTRGFNPGAGLCAWLWPGLGHIVIGQKRRGYLIMTGVVLLILFGVLIGGLNVVDRVEARLWFYAQSFGGPLVFAVDWLNQMFAKQWPDELRYERHSIGRVYDIGVLYVALAGLMNLAAIIDALAPLDRDDEKADRRNVRPPEPRDRRAEDRQEGEAASGG